MSRIIPPPQHTQHTPLSNMLQELRVRDTGHGSLLGASVGSALDSLWANRLRSLLTMLGIVIGIAAVIGALTLTQGVGAYIDNLILGQGATSVFIRGHDGPVPSSLTARDLQSLKRLAHVTAISPFIYSGGQIVYGNNNWRTEVDGSSASVQTIQNWQMAEGIWFNSVQEADGEPVAVIGDTVKQHLFAVSGIDPIGKKIHIGNEIFRVVGVLAAKGGFRSDDIIFVPYKALQDRLSGNTVFNEIDIQADSRSSLDLVVQEVSTVLRTNHRLRPGVQDDFQTRTSVQILQQVDQATQVITFILTSIAAISLTVGGIGVMNIMLVSVTERVREIGIRMSLGARRRDIRNQFLAEALFLCLLGGIIGLLLGVLVGWLMVGVLIGAITGASGGAVPLVITPTTLILPFAVSAAIGIVFGLYPALRAARLDPIVALRRAK
ncbi:MAG: ABC transporter permease [Chloroflexota bacterium]|nr:ABC transporter permease [Chloroflexota bacterium]